MTKVITQKILDPDDRIYHMANFRILTVDRMTGNESYVPLALFTRDDN